MDKMKALYSRYLTYLKARIKELREDRNALIFLFFLFLSTCFWILNALSKDNYTTELKYPIRYTNSNKDELITGDVRRDLTLKVRGGGFSILNYHLNEKFLTQTIDLTGLPRVKLKGSEGVIISTKEYQNRIEGKLATGMSLVDISPDTLFVPLVDNLYKKLPVVLDAKIDFAQQCQLAGRITIQPDSITVSGPSNILDTLTAIQTKGQLFSELKDTLKRNVGLKEVDWLTYSSKRVVINIPVEPFTEASVQVPIHAEGLPDSLQLKAFPSEVNVSYRLGLSKASYKPSDFSFALDFSVVDLNNLPHRVKVKLKRKPSQIGQMSYTPLFVEFLLEKNSKSSN
ncbi:YbbR-like domain-containing protein [Carboxylicivirga linearis]|uniref:YbbR-like domain-containing protein n=1 Tax=Carboxylicivirga linearis TaxID=1628157 RepID=A0ABS5JYW9_9BACT|nr:YbbR-like domain-containing protein [Carboxylicivirga linearis]MBS2100039.1 YbbR-like domain-containing protein [Carboxylicivirga linearis]